MSTVSEITATLKNVIETSSDLQDVWMRGVISNIDRPRNGNIYFKLNNDEMEYVIFSNNQHIIDVSLEIGNHVCVNGEIQLYTTRSEYRFVVQKIQLSSDPLQEEYVSFNSLTDTMNTVLEVHSVDVQGEISKVFEENTGNTILHLKDSSFDGRSKNIIQCSIAQGLSPSFSLQRDEKVHVTGRFGIARDINSYRINVDNENNIARETTQRQTGQNECKKCNQYSDNLRDRLCPICYDASLTSEGIVVGAVVRYFSGHKFSGFFTERERRIPFGVNVGRADVALSNNDNRLFAIAECKRIGYNGSDRIEQGQLKSYLNASGTNLGIFADDTDPYEWIFLKKNSENGNFDEISRSQFERELGVEPTSEIPPGRTRLELIRGNIIESEVDAIVNAANSQLTKGSGVDGAIRDAGGEEIERECQEIVGHRGVPQGRAVITTGGNLHASHVIHAIGPIWDGGEQHEAETLNRCYKNTLKIAAEKGIKSIAFPAISTGNFGFPIEEATPIALNTVKEFVEQAHQNNEMVPEHIQFVLFDKENYNCYVKELANLGLGISCLIG